MREQLSMAQIGAAVGLFLRNVMDNSLPLPIQMMSAKLMLNLVQVRAGRRGGVKKSGGI